ncbi:MAG: ABC transporter permease [Candidatus Rifleibacteriota bacterium]
MKFKRVAAIFKKDLLDSFKNYNFILMVLTPVILSLLFSNLMSGANSDRSLPELGLIGNPKQPLIKSLQSQGMGEKLTFFESRNKLESAILENKVKLGIILPDSLLAADKGKKPVINLLYSPNLPEFSVQLIKTAIEEEIRKKLNLSPPPLPVKLETHAVASTSNLKGGMSDTIFPMLIIMSMGMIGFIGLPMAIVEEKEKGTLNAIFLTPVTTSEFIIGKSLFGFFLSLFTILTILTLNGKWSGNNFYLILFVLLGIFLTIFIGLIISLFAKTQGSVNGIGTTLFLFFQIIPSLQSTSKAIEKIAFLSPSTHILAGIKKAMFLDLTKVNIQKDLIIVFALTIFTYIFCFSLFKLKKADK